MNLVNPAYLAGVLDSDGSFTITKRHMCRTSCNYTAMIQLTWVNTPSSLSFMEELVSACGGSFYRGKSHSGFDKKSPIVKYCATGKAALLICEAVRPHIKLKSAQVQNLIDLINKNKLGRDRPAETTRELELLYQNNRQLNSKNGATICE